MSHVATIELQIKNLDALERACQACGLELRRNQKTYKWYGRWVNDYHGNDAAYRHGIDPKDYGKCAHAIGVPGDKDAYEIGLVDDGEGGYRMIYDFYGNQGRKIMDLAGGQDCGALVQEYQLQVVEEEAAPLLEQGYEMERLVGENGDIQLVLTQGVI